MSTTHQLRGRVVPFAARIEATGRAPRVLERRGWLTGYAAETLADDALHAGAGARVDVHVPATAVSAVDACFDWLRRRGIALAVHADEHGPAML